MGLASGGFQTKAAVGPIVIPGPPRHPRESGDPAAWRSEIGPTNPSSPRTRGSIAHTRSVDSRLILRHPRGGGDPSSRDPWIPACAGMTVIRLRGNDGYPVTRQ